MSMRLVVWVLALFAAAFFINTRHADFPYFYHPDEPGKVRQILTGEWNFHHPMLLLGATEAVAKLAGNPTDQQTVVELGRKVSATLMALAVVALSLLAWLWRGWPAAVIAGLLLLGHHQLFELAHYFKEDSALLAGMALTFLALLAFEKRPTLGRAALLGAACGLAVSGKYLGVIGALLALPVLWRARRPANFAVFLATLALTFALVNLPLLLHLATFRASLNREMDFVVHGQRGMTRSVPHAQYWNVFIDNTTPAIWLLLGLFLSARWQQRRSLTLAEWLLVAFPFVYTIALSFSPKSNDRYFLPATAMFTLFAALGALDAAALFPRYRRWLPAIAAVLIVSQLPSAWRYDRAFRHDDTAELIEWLNHEVPPDAVIAKDSRIQLPDPEKKAHASRLGVVPQKIIAERFAADVGTLAELRAQGVDYVAISQSDYGRFFLKSLRPQEGEQADFERRAAFYRELLDHGKLVFARDRGTVIYLHPGIRVYELAP